MFYVVTRSGVKHFKSLNVLNKVLGVSLELDEFFIRGADFIVQLDGNLKSGDLSDLEFIRDKAKMEKLCFAGFFKKDNSGKVLTLINIFFSFIILLTIKSLIKAIGG